jgi:hypothetical protein
MDARYYQPFVTALTQIGLAIVRTQPDKAAIDAQWVALAGLPGERVLEALARGLKEWTQFPSPAEIARLVRTIDGEEAARREARRKADYQASIRCPEYSFLLAMLADPDVPEEKKARIKSTWRPKNPNQRPPWEEDQCQQTMSR